MAHACNPSYTGGRDQEDRGSQDRILKKPITKTGLGEWFKVKALSSNPSTTKKKKKKKERKEGSVPLGINFHSLDLLFRGSSKFHSTLLSMSARVGL
jgi:hypothetical protein